MIRLQNIKLPINYNENDFLKIVSKELSIKQEKVKSITLSRLSIDARNKKDVHYVATFDIEVSDFEESIVKNSKKAKIEEVYEYIPPQSDNKPSLSPIIVGSGPAGLFAGYILALSGFKPIIIEQGQCVEDRIKSVEKMFGSGVLNKNSNIQFGEGGAGTFSDGKLNTGIKDKRIKYVLKTFNKFGASDDILYLQKPHIGTDVLRNVVVNMREEIISLGGEFMFDTKFVDFETKDDKISSITVVSDGIENKIPCENLVLAIGHSARDTFEMLYDKKINMEQKPFAMGVRIEHNQELINKAQYGENYNKSLPPADYKLAVHLESGRGVYTFCMCPGGYVVAAASEDGAVVTNGMSEYKRDGKNANSALLVGITPDDFESDHPLAGIEIQRKLERDAYLVSKSYKAPAQTIGGFLSGTTPDFKAVTPSYKPGVVNTDLNEILPNFISDSLKEGLKLLDKKIKGFADENAVLTAPETRSSSPVRILRNDEFYCNIKGIYPCGEGAGYAGGITSAAVDGIKIAEAIISKK